MKYTLFFLFSLCSFGFTNASDKTVILKDEKSATVPNGYRISGVIDDRADKSKIGDIDSSGNISKLILQNGASSIKGYLENNMPQDKSAKPMFLHITQFDAAIKYRDGTWTINTTSTITFYASGYKLVEYKSKAHAEIGDNPENYEESYIRKLIDEDLKAFNQWWPENENQIAVTDDVQVNVHIATTSDNPDYIVYSLQRPLQIADFTGPPQGQGDEMAATLSGIDFKTSGAVEKGQTIVDVIITPYFDLKQSWFKEEGKVPAVLAHEQAHFDITAIKACELADSIRAMKFTKENYEKLLNNIYQENTKAGYEEEITYDTETNHGIITDKQQSWQKALTEKIKTIGCY